MHLAASIHGMVSSYREAGGSDVHYSPGQFKGAKLCLVLGPLSAHPELAFPWWERDTQNSNEWEYMKENKAG